MAADLLWRPFDRQYIANPYAMYKRLREEDPVHQSQTGEWIITRYEDTRNILRSADFLVGNRFEWLKKGVGYFKYKDVDFSPIENAMKGFILFLNPPHHMRIRKFIHQVWNSREVEAIINENLETLLNNASGTIDLVNDLGKPLPAMTIGRILGLPPKDYAYLKEQGSVMIKALDLYISFKDILSINEAAQNFIAYFKKVVAEKEKHPDDGIVSKLIQLNKQEGTLSDDELISTCILLFIAGEETSIGLMSTGLYNLLSHAEVIGRLRKNPHEITKAIEELLRFDSPVQIVGRIAGKDTLIGDKQIKAGEAITICLGAANRDPEVFDRPDEFLIDRTDNKHLAFGGGAHYCLGDWLARMQTQLMVEKLLKKHQKIILINPTPEWNSNLAIRTLVKLPVSIK
jgi:pimeloyl-[acyl-carrier protein] synthase